MLCYCNKESVSVTKCVEFLEQNPEAKKILRQSRKRFLIDQKDTSVFSKFADSPCTLYFNAFLVHPVILDPREDISIYPTFLAKAYFHRDVYTIVKELCSAIFKQEDLDRRNEARLNGISNESALDALPPIKKDLIEKLAKRILRKQTYPWSYSRSPILEDQDPKWSDVELKDIDRAFLDFDKINEVHSDLQAFQNCHVEYGQWLEEQIRNGPVPPFPANTVSKDGTARIVEFQRGFENFFYQDNFQLILTTMINANLCVCNTVQIVRELTKETVNNTIPVTDVFSDAAQFSKERWTQAKALLKRGNEVKAAEVLFRKFIRMDFQSKPFISIDESFCPVKFLAITRAIARLKVDDGDEEHGHFLPWETVDNIKDFLHRKYSGKTGAEMPSFRDDSCTQPTDPLQLVHLNSTVSTTLENGIVNDSPINGNSILMEVDQHQFQQLNLQCDNGYAVRHTDFLNGTEVVVLSNILDTYDLSYIEGINFNENIQPTTAPNCQPVTDPVGVVASSYHGVDAAPDMIRYEFDAHNLVIVGYDRRLTYDEWTRACKKTSEKKPEDTVRGKFLFNILFNDEEVANGTYSGQEGKEVYSKDKLNFILDLLPVLKELRINGIHEWDTETLPILNNPVCKLTDLERENITTKVFQGYAYSRRTKIERLRT